MMKARAAAFGLLLASILPASQPASAGPVNDLLVDFGSRGLWVFLNNSSWQQLDAQDPGPVAACDDGTIYAVFSGRGLLRRSVARSAWETVRADLVPYKIAAGDTDGNDVCDIGALMWPQPPARRSKLIMGLNHASGWITLYDSSFILEKFTFGNFDGSPNDDIAGVSSERGDILGYGVAISYNNLGVNASGESRPCCIATGDIDGDGLDEIVAQISGGLYVYHDPWPRPTWPDAIRPTLLGHFDVGEVAVGNLDADPREDILYSARDGVRAIYNDTTTFPGVKLDGRRASHLAVADLDNNGVGDPIASVETSRGYGQGVFARYGASGFQVLRGWRVAALVPCACD